MVGTGY